MQSPVYLDNHATTQLDPRVLEAMMPFLTERFGNAASRNHLFGWEAEKGVETARQQVADLIGASPREIIFTSGATESDNLALTGAMRHYAATRGRHLVTVATEHKAVIDTARALNSEGYDVTFVGVGADGRVRPEEVAAALTDETVVVSVMLANNEIGVINPLSEIGRICRSRGVLLHTDAVQGVGKIAFDVEAMQVDMASISAHKIYGPKGVGALYVRRRNPRVRLEPIIHGGGHERGFRSGTLNVPGIVGFGQACSLAGAEMGTEAERIGALRDRLWQRILTELDEVHLNGSAEHRLPGNLNVSFGYVQGESLMLALDDIAVSSGSACTSASLEPSYVLRALGVQEELADSSIRFGLGRFNTADEIEYVADKLVAQVRRLREMSPLYEMAKSGVDLSSVRWTVH